MRCPKCDTFEVPGGVSACVECALSEAIRQRDEARALVAVEARRADAWKAEADRLTGRLEELRAAVCEAYEESLHRPKMTQLVILNGGEP